MSMPTVAEQFRGFTLRRGLRPGDLGEIVRLHGELYAREQGWNSRFEAYVAAGLAEYVLSPASEPGELWIAEDDAGFAGCIAIVGRPEQVAQLRWFLVHPRARGRGLGWEFMRRALGFCRQNRFRSVFLWTVRGLEPAAHLYERAGFVLAESKTSGDWGPEVIEERHELDLGQ